MALSLSVGSSTRKRDQILAVDLGSRTTKAVQLQRRGAELTLSRFALLDAPVFGKSPFIEILTEHLRAVTTALDSRLRPLCLSTGVNDAIVRPLELPAMPLDDMRMVLKHNTKGYLQQDLANHVFDCHPLGSPTAPAAEAGKAAATPKQKVLVAAGKQELVNEFVEGAKGAGLSAECVVPGLVGPLNAFELACPEAYAHEVVALIDIGFKSSAVSILQGGELMLSRVVGLGGDRLTHALSEALSISYAEAEGIKVGMAGEVQDTLQTVLVPMARELRAAIDFFEHQHDKPVSALYLTGGSTRSEIITQILQQELMIEARPWSPTSSLKLDLPPQQAAEIEHVAPQLTVAIGAAIAAL
jgi:type IV pilus assembly protein PilM